jgi:hypothetical protein
MKNVFRWLLTNSAMGALVYAGWPLAMGGARNVFYVWFALHCLTLLLGLGSPDVLRTWQKDGPLVPLTVSLVFTSALAVCLAWYDSPVLAFAVLAVRGLGALLVNSNTASVHARRASES